jgi:hypothetical protein
VKHEAFYVIRGDQTYSVNKGDLQHDDIGDAIRAAVDQANRGRQSYGVYKVQLVGVAAPPAATYTPVKAEGGPPNPHFKEDDE